MKRLKLYIVYLFIIWILVQNVFFWYAFANDDQQNCVACNVMPNSMQMFVDFEVELIWILNWVSAEWKSYKTEWRRKWLFSSKFFRVIEDFVPSLFSKFSDNAEKSAKVVRTMNISVVILDKMYTSSIMRDSWSSISILFRSKPIVRDYKVLQEIDMSIDDLIWDLGQEDLWNKNISDEVLKEIILLQSKYSQWGQYPIFSKFQVSGDIKYNQLVKWMLKLNSSMKYFLSSNNKKILFSSIDSVSKWWLTMVIDPDYLNRLLDNYSCVNLFLCDETFDKTISDFLALWKIKNSMSETWRVIKQANDDFRAVYRGIKGNIERRSNKENSEENKQILTDKQIQLLRTVYGIDSSKLTDSEWRFGVDVETDINPLLTDSEVEFYKRLWSKTKSWVWEFRDVVVLKKKKISNESRNNSIENHNTKSKEKIDDKYIENLSGSEIDALNFERRKMELWLVSWKDITLGKLMQNTVDSVLDQKTEDKNILLISINQDTHYFIEIGKYIHLTMDEVIWDKSWDWIVKNLWNVCEYQCSNKWNSNCYY